MKAKFILLLTICLLFSFSENNLVTAQTRNKPLLFFSKDDVTKLKEVNYTNNFTLNENEFLNIHFTLEKPLIKSLQLLDETLTEDELLQIGSFQLSFIVDGKIIYVENLHKGAGLKAFKTEQIDHVVRLITPEQIDFWGWFMWLKFMKIGGGQDALHTGNHELTIEIRPYIKQEKLSVGALLAAGTINVEVPEIQVDQALIAVQKIAPSSDWIVSNDSFDRHKIEALNRKIAEKRFEDINSIVVIKNNKLLIEEYFNDAARESLHNPRSVGKSIASTMLGIAIEENFISDEDAQLKDFYDLKSFNNFSIEKENVTLKSLLTMSSGFVGDDSDYNSLGNEENMYPTKNWVKFTLDLPMQDNKDSDFAYFTAGVVVLGDVIHKSVPKGLVSYANEKLFTPLSITNYKWEYTPQKVGNTAGGIRLRAIDFAKYGQLYKNRGMWNGKQILDKNWVKKSLAKQVKQSINSEDYYGYLFWNKTFSVNNKNYEVSYCSGRGGNKIFVFNDIPFVVVITSSAYNIPNAHINVDKMMVDYILPAILKN
ncbi:hypothetical protein ULMS_17300 [Patiriisocius marinistellae]|uniref:Beta-lactamase-related domain-containing protein n=1 Tax=Patiriisocius marinistellae TaxID=2494560 RepID=A0A5J4FYC1_9FLAO|nr:serine hydrolase [Patiriisocius marinistellae]GEQ86222.1 hypothetical protein ULMS_17300 [Patiriisocius marinistellae]